MNVLNLRPVQPRIGIDRNSPLCPKYLCNTIMSVHRSPTTVELQYLSIGKFNNGQCVVGILVFDQFGVSDILTEGEDSVYLFLWVGEVGRLGSVEHPSGNVDIVDT